MPKIGIIFNGVWSQYTFARADKYKDLYSLLYVHSLTQQQLETCDALVVPFQSNHAAIAAKKDLIFQFLASGKRMFVEGDSSAFWLDAQWEDRPVNNYWWVKDPANPPASVTNFNHPIYQGLKPRHAFWHYHGVYTRIPEGATVIQKNTEGHVVTWESDAYGGTLLVTTLDPIVEHGVQQITHLDHYCDRLTHWLCGVWPEGSMTWKREDFGVAYPV